MPRAVDPHALQVTHDPTYSIQYDLRAAFGQGVDLWQAVIDMIVEKAEDFVKELIQRLIGVPVDLDQALDDLFAQVPNIQDIPGLGDLIELLTGIEDGDMNDLGTWALGIRNALAGIDLSNPGALLQVFLGQDSPLNVLNLFGQIRPDQLGNIPISHIGDFSAELLTNPKFDGAISMSGQNMWFWREDEGRTSPGSAWTNADSIEQELLSNFIPVSPGQKLHGRVWSRWNNLVATGAAIRLEYALFNQIAGVSPAPMGTLLLDKIESPPAASGWSKLEGQITVPEDVNQVRLRLVVGNTASSGEVGFDDGSAFKSGFLPQWLVENLVPDLNAITSHLRAWVESALAVFGITPSGNLLDDIFDLSDEIDWLKGQAEAGISHAQDALNDVASLAATLLTDPAAALGQIPQMLVAGLQGTVQEMNQVRDLLAGYVVTPINAAVQDIKTWLTNQTSQISAANGNLLSLANSILSALRGVPVVGGAIADRLEDVLEDLGVLRSTATAAETKADEVQQGIINGWAGTTTTGTDIDVYDTLAAIRAMVGNEGYIRQGFTSSQRWVIPTGVTEIVSIAISSGQNGAPGSDPGGIGGMGGGFKVTALDPATLDALYLQVGTGGNPTRIRNDNASGAILSEAVPGGGGAMSTSFGYTSSSSGAGAGGNGGRGFTTSAERLPGNPGISTPAAVGGAGGIGSSEDGVWGAPGGSVSASAIVPCGGAGGGGGEGGGYSGGLTIGNGGRGGDGGFPGGGGGGGGGRGTYAGFHGSQGSGGNGAAGLVILFYR